MTVRELARGSRELTVTEGPTQGSADPIRVAHMGCVASLRGVYNPLARRGASPIATVLFIVWESWP